MDNGGEWGRDLWIDPLRPTTKISGFIQTLAHSPLRLTVRLVQHEKRIGRSVMQIGLFYLESRII